MNKKFEILKMSGDSFNASHSGHINGHINEFDTSQRCRADWAQPQGQKTVKVPECSSPTGTCDETALEGKDGPVLLQSMGLGQPFSC